MEKTDLEKVKKGAKLLFDMVEMNFKFGFVCQHPYTNTRIVFVPKNTKGVKEYCEKYPNINPEPSSMIALDLEHVEARTVYKNFVFSQIDEIKNIDVLLIILNKPWYMTFLKLTNELLSKEDLGRFLGSAWIHEEYPNRDSNVSHEELVDWFEKADKNTLMDEQELEQYHLLKSLKITVYRGVNEKGKANGLSWTTDYDKALWFSKRYDGGNQRVYQMTITNPDNILAYFGNRGESEVIVNTLKQKNWKLINKEN
jgi:hypothetical protein